MDEHVCCITASLLGMNVDFATEVATLKVYMAEQPCNVDYLTAIQPLLPYLRGRTDHRTYWKHVPTT